MSRINRPPMSLAGLVRHMKKDGRQVSNLLKPKVTSFDAGRYLKINL